MKASHGLGGRGLMMMMMMVVVVVVVVVMMAPPVRLCLTRPRGSCDVPFLNLAEVFQCPHVSSDRSECGSVPWRLWGNWNLNCECGADEQRYSGYNSVQVVPVPSNSDYLRLQTPTCSFSSLWHGCFRVLGPVCESRTFSHNT